MNTKEIVTLRDQGKSFAEIGRKFGITRQYAHHLYKLGSGETRHTLALDETTWMMLEKLANTVSLTPTAFIRTYIHKKHAMAKYRKQIKE